MKIFQNGLDVDPGVFYRFENNFLESVVKEI